MSFESPDNEKNFPGLYKAGSLSDQTSVSEEDHDKSSKKKDLGKKKDGKKDKKEKGYMMFEEEDSEEDMVSLDDVKSPSKGKKSKPGFKFPARKDIFPKKEKEDHKKEKETKKEEKKKEEKEGKKHKLKEKKKSKHTHHDVAVTVAAPNEYEKPIFGVPLAVSVERNKSHDGIELPAIFRECVDYIEEYGLSCEGIYRISGVKSKVQHLKDCYNKGVPVYLQDHEPNVIASLLKQFLRDLPEPVLTTALMPKFEEASTIKNEKKRIEQFRKLIDDLPTPNRLLLSWMIVHMTHIIELQKENKMTLQNVSIVLSPTMQISHRVLNILFTYAGQLFADTIVKRYVPPLKPATSRWSLELPDNPAALEEELAKQESLLNQLHGELNAGVTDSAKEEQLWEVQRVVTQLKRKIKFAKKAVEAVEKRRKDIENKKLSTHLPEEEELDLTPKKPEPKTKKSASKEGTPEVEKIEKAKESKVKDTTRPVSEAADQKEAESQNEATSQKEAETQKEDKEGEKKRDSQTEKGGVQVTVKADVVKSAEEEPEKQEESPEIESKEKTDESSEKKEEETTKVKEEKKVEDKPEKKKTKKKSEPVSLHPHIHLSSEPLQPIKAEQPVLPKKEETEEDSLKKSVEIRELEEEFLGDGKTEKKVKFSEQTKERVVEEEPEIPETEVEVEIVDKETEWQPIDDEELQKLLEEEEAMKMEEEELLAIGDELRQKIETEQSEIERLHQEIQELHYLRQDSDLEDLSSSSESSYDSEDEEDLQDILSQLISENEDLEKKNAELCQKIHEERMICLSVKLQIRLLQQKQLETSQSSVGGTDRETFL